MHINDALTNALNGHMIRINLNNLTFCLPFSVVSMSLNSGFAFRWFTIGPPVSLLLKGMRKCPVLSPFLTERMFLREPSWKYSAKLAGS